MAYTINLHKLAELSHDESKNEILLQTNEGTELHIKVEDGQTIITFPFGNKFDTKTGRTIIIHKA
jgi:hypothetical protein